MKKLMKRALSVLLSLSVLAGLLPAASLSALAAEPSVYSLDNQYIRVDVSAKNGGFSITNGTGDKINKADDNKNLLYHSGEYDTSFTSFQVTYHPGTPSASTTEYVFGGSYGFLGTASSKVNVTQASGRIDAVWSVGDLTFTQSISLANDGANEHGMVNISYAVGNSGSVPASVKARVLLDTALGEQDYAYYEVIDAGEHYRSIKTETVLTASDAIPQNFFGYDSPYNPTVTAYTVSAQGNMPYQAAFGHWNNLAATAFDFAPDDTMNFTDPYNDKYLTADSAYALYYDLGAVAARGGSSSFLTYYGVYAHRDVSAGDSMTVDVVSPSALSLNGGKTAFVRQSTTGSADFEVQAELGNFISDTARGHSSVTLAVFTGKGLMPLGAGGAEVPGFTYENTTPYTVSYSDIAVGETISDILYFKARVDTDAQFRKIRLAVYDTSASATITAENLLGSAVFYILCPGSDGNLPKVTFTSLSPAIIYCAGTRHLFLAGTNIDILYTSIQSGTCTLRAYTQNTGDDVSVTVAKEQVFQPDDQTLDVILTDSMVTGAWYLQLDWSDGAVSSGIVTAENKNQTAPALNFTVTDDVKYKNDTYGVIAVVQTAKAGAGTTPTYRIKSFSGESKFQAYQEGAKQPDGSYLKDYVEILLVLRGEFEVKATTIEGTTYVPTRVTATSLKASVDAKATNCISINNCIDFENGVLTVSYASTAGAFGNVRVEFDGELYTSDARTSIWDGEAAFTEIEQGKEFSLIPYDADGIRSNTFTDNPISLVWPSVFGVGQTIAGMVFNLAYGELGVMKDSAGKELGRVLSFSAKLDLGFLIPDKENDKIENTYWTRLKNFWKFYNEGKGGMYSYWAVENVDNIMDFSNEESGKDQGTASVMVQDILYGCGAGFVGVHFNAAVTLPNYVAGMPKIQARLEVNTIGNWSFGFDGKMEMATFTLEVSLAIKSYQNIPVPDKIYFFVSGFEPGINVDGCGVIWITGGGGGIDKLYDTIFLTDTVPPLKLLLSVSFDLIKVLSARADFSVSLTGISFSASDIKLKATNIVALKKAAAEFDWYPDLYLMGAIQMSLFDFITGSGYIVLQGKNYTDWFFEAFVRASVQIPRSIPIVGGIQLAQVDLGISTEKVWGALKVLCITLGVTYYWGGDVSFGVGDSSSPTYPNLLGCEDVPVYYDAQTNRTLYMRVGTNLSLAARAQIADNFDRLPKLMGAAALYSSGDRRTHRFNLGSRDAAGSDAAVQIGFSVANPDGTFPEQDMGLAKARAVAETILGSGVKDGSGNKYGVVLYDGSNADTANANVTYDPATGRGGLSLTMTDDGCYDKDWNLTTPVAAELILYHVAAVPEITAVSGTPGSSGLNLSWGGAGLSGLDSVSFYLVSDKDDLDDAGYVLTELTDSAAIAAGSAANVKVPAGVPSGGYYIRAVYVQDGVVNGVINSDTTVAVVNSDTPAAPSISAVAPGGDLKLKIALDSLSADAYVANVYRRAEGGGWEYSDVSGMTFNAADLKDGALFVGGSYTYEGETRGLAAGIEYRVGISAVNYVDSDGDGTDDTAVPGAERYYGSAAAGKTVADIESATSVVLPTPTPPEVSLSASAAAREIPRTVGAETQTVGTYAVSDLTFAVTCAEAITGTWFLDEGDAELGTVAGKSASIALTGLTEGDHTLVVKGHDGGGDGFRKTCLFAVDTLAPRLLLSAPTNGSFFNRDGTLTVSGSTDADALFTILCDGVRVCAAQSIQALGGAIDSDGTFSFTVPLPNPDQASLHHVTITASDAVGNQTGREADVIHGGLANVKALDVYANGIKWSNGNINTNQLTARTAQLTLVATTGADKSFVLTDERMVSWTCLAVEGTAAVTDGGQLAMGADSVGYVTGALRVASSGSLTAGLTFGAERYGSSREVVTGTSLGGRVTGGGLYDVGETVVLTAIPAAGYIFTGWTLDGAAVSDLSSKTITFLMPDGNVVATAGFTAQFSEIGGNADRYSILAAAGEKVKFRLPAGVDGNRFVACYMKGAERTCVPMSTVIGGFLVFIAPVGGTYDLVQRDVAFGDTAGHWAEPSIHRMAARDLFGGVASQVFSPNTGMTRAMFVTVLWRLAGQPSSGSGQFADVPAGQWYSAAASWAAQKGIVTGYDSGRFGPNDAVTREQMCAMLLRYLNALGFDAAKVAKASAFADEDAVSAWAKSAVAVCHALGIVNGKGENRFDPRGLATRAECCAMFDRLITAYLNSI